jgi:hypothetical protein
MILERHVQIIKPEMARSYKEWEKRWVAFEARLGNFPPKQYYSVLSGSNANGTMIWEREWESFTAMEREYMRMFADSEGEEINKLPVPVASETTEFYFKESLGQ